MVDAEGRDAGDDGLGNDIGRVVRAADTDFEDRRIDLGAEVRILARRSIKSALDRAFSAPFLAERRGTP